MNICKAKGIRNQTMRPLTTKLLMKKLAILFATLLPLLGQSQQIIETGIFVGFANYQGDLSDNQIVLKESKKSFGGFIRFHYEDRFKIRGNVYYGFIGGDDSNARSDKQHRGWKFDGTILEVAIAGEYHPLGRGRAGNTGIFRPQFSPYIASGLGYTFTHINLVVPSSDSGLFPEANNVDNFISVPLMAGFRLDLQEHLSFSAEWGWRAIFSDYLDNVSVNGNPKRNDWYLFVGASVSYFFGSFTPDYFKGKEQ